MILTTHVGIKRTIALMAADPLDPAVWDAIGALSPQATPEQRRDMLARLCAIPDDAGREAALRAALGLAPAMPSDTDLSAAAKDAAYGLARLMRGAADAIEARLKG